MIYEYTGEYGTEFTIFIPYIYYLKTNGLFDGKVLTYLGMKCYYFFLSDDEIQFKPDSRRFVPDHDRDFVPDHLRNDDDFIMNRTNPLMYLPPPYHDFFNTLPIDIDQKPVVLIFNKYNSEWGTTSPPCNYFDLHELNMLAYVFQDCNVVYFRSNNIARPDYAKDHDEKEGMIEYWFAEKEFLKHYQPHITLFEDLLEINPGTDYNTAKAILLSRAALTISTLTGTTHFAYYFHTKHILYRKMAPHPFSTPTYYNNMHKLLSRNENAKISYVTSQKQLLSACHQQGLPTRKYPIYDR